MAISDYIDQAQLSAKAQEACRLLDTLKYYDWLDSHGASWDTVKGLAFVWVNKPGSRPTKGLSVKLKSGKVLTLPLPPFSDAVIWNRRHYCEDGGPTVPQGWQSGKLVHGWPGIRG